MYVGVPLEEIRNGGFLVLAKALQAHWQANTAVEVLIVETLFPVSAALIECIIA